MNKVHEKKYKNMLCPGKIFICIVLAVFMVLSCAANCERAFASESTGMGNYGVEDGAGAEDGAGTEDGSGAEDGTSTGNGAGDENSFDPEYLRSIVDLIKDKYAGEVDYGKLLEGAIRGMFSTMDPYTSYFDQSQGRSLFWRCGRHIRRHWSNDRKKR